MPYNNTPIAPPPDVTGTVSLPLARVKKIINADDDVQNCSNNAAFAIAVATEMFIRDLVSKTHDQAKLQKKPRRNIRYDDVANAVTRNDNLEFLLDVVPKTVSYQYVLLMQEQRDMEKQLQERRREAKERENQNQASGPVGGIGGGDAMDLDRPSTANHESRASTSREIDILNNTAPTNPLFSRPYHNGSSR